MTQKQLTKIDDLIENYGSLGNALLSRHARNGLLSSFRRDIKDTIRSAEKYVAEERARLTRESKTATPRRRTTRPAYSAVSSFPSC